MDRGKLFRGVYRLYTDTVHLFAGRPGNDADNDTFIQGLDNADLDEVLGELANDLREELELVLGASNEFDLDLYLSGDLTPVFFGSAIANLGVDELMSNFAEHAPPPQGRSAESREVSAAEENSLDSCLKYKPIWIRHITIELRLCVSHQENSLRVRS